MAVESTRPFPDTRPMPMSRKAAAAAAASKKKVNDPGLFNGARHLIPGWCVMLVVLGWASINFLVDAHRIAHIAITPNVDVTAFDVARLANDTCSIILCLLVFVLWLTICFKFVFIRHIWSWKTKMFGGLTMMPGGFVPRPAAVSVGLLMFLTQVFIAERVVPGDKLYNVDHQHFYTNAVAHGEVCRADVREESHYQDDWFSRLMRSNPSGCYFGKCPENSTDLGCSENGTGPSLPGMFNTVLSDSAPHVPMPNVINPYNQSSHIVINMFQAAQSRFPTIFGHQSPVQVGNLVIDDKNKCLYQCVKWRVWGFNGLVTKGGVITVGAASVSKMTETVSGFCGLMRVTEDTSEKTLLDILDKTKPDKTKFFYRYFHKSALVPALIFVALRLFFAFWVFKIDDYGFFTVDFYVSQVLLFSVSTAFFLRSINPFRWERIAYTQNLWIKGSDKFMVVPLVDDESCLHTIPLDPKPLKPTEVDLYMWLHMSHEERAFLLINYARQISKKEEWAKNAQVELLTPHCFEASAPVIAEGGKDLPWGTKKVMEMRALKVVPHGSRSPGGVVAKLDAEMAHVTWHLDHIQHDDGTESAWSDAQNWLKSMKASKEYQDDLNRAITSPVDPMHLVEVSDKFTEMMDKHVPLEIRKVTIDKILKRVKNDLDMKSEQSWWQWVKGKPGTKDKNAMKAKKEKAKQAEVPGNKASHLNPLLPVS